MNRTVARIPARISALRSELLRLTADGATGTLRVGVDGAVHLNEGAVSFVECGRCPPLKVLLTVAGKVEDECWDRAQNGGEPGPILIQDGLLTPTELEMFVLLSVYDAGFALLSAPAAMPKFTAQAPHWLAPVWRTTAERLIAESDRRAGALDMLWSGPPVDEEPVTPLRRMDRQRLALTGLQAEILLNADGRRTPAALARDLGRTRYGCLAAVRGLAAAGLLENARAPEPVIPLRTRAARTATQLNRRSTPLWTEIDEDLLTRLHHGLSDLT